MLNLSQLKNLKSNETAIKNIHVIVFFRDPLFMAMVESELGSSINNEIRFSLSENQ